MPFHIYCLLFETRPDCGAYFHCAERVIWLASKVEAHCKMVHFHVCFSLGIWSCVFHSSLDSIFVQTVALHSLYPLCCIFNRLVGNMAEHLWVCMPCPQLANWHCCGWHEIKWNQACCHHAKVLPVTKLTRKNANRFQHHYFFCFSISCSRYNHL